jgi:hypothetical protein
MACTQAGSAQRLKVGTYDSRAVALAYWRSAEGQAYIGGLQEDLQSAKAEGHGDRVAQLEALGPILQSRMHQQVFSVGSIKAITSKISSVFPRIAREAGTQLIVSKWEIVFDDPSVEFVDVTSRIVDVFKPTPQILQMIDQAIKKAPVPIDDLKPNP